MPRVANVPPAARLPLLALGFVALVLGIGAGLARFAWPMPGVVVDAAAWHGPLMLCGFFGAVIGLERAVALGRPWAYGGPLAAGAATIALIAHRTELAIACSVLSSVVLLAATCDIARRQRALFTLVLALAAACWAWGCAWWLIGGALRAVAAWWFLFLVLTIAAERLELSRFMPPSRNTARVFVGIVILVLSGGALIEQRIGRAAVGVSFIALAAWLLKQDIARRTVRGRGLPRYVALCLLSGYAWLAVAGVLIAVSDALYEPAARDAALHALGVGFVLSMVFGHAPIIVPAVLRIAVPYGPALYAPVIVLHASMVLRVLGSAISFEVARIGALGNAIALALFIATLALRVRAGRRAGVPAAA